MPRFVTHTGTFLTFRAAVFAVLFGVAPVAAKAQSSWEPTAPRLSEHVRLTIAGNSRFAGDIVGRASAERQLATLGLLPASARGCEGPFAVVTGETVWLATARPAVSALPRPDSIPAIILVRTDSQSTVVSLTVLFHDEETVARHYPRDDGIRRISLAEQRNRQAVQRLHGVGTGRRVLAANRERVFVTVPGTQGDSAAWRLVAYTFDATGAVRSMVASAPLPSSVLSTIR